ncbi:nucleoside diphosphate kinase 6 isoform X1 [Macaca nemestrina]|uniref:nucleoside diphosphate kinase 6 isoform X1 n=1 Tax=Macaca nemestrina TaxID=9545 RepID=UPI0005F46953|nr:nucleoside diphosphate kinase 6 isoform X1 [Macaca nemestrina]XP_011737496.1 nucleoside diphosphate kinase 6 isoform X1 [Macaca nemestrina]XP_011737497.1 nucleoside diphosphate kinase 6 isoform X1 [Macaca nemestrina]XP_011737499.1 nucleoside diphosphate kinase 6 isoform X1 [Macaca nemestrina]XP_011737500.1 nucleoside diphosphate kinase 6 isoform X1 [Macaca nemestrina]
MASILRSPQALQLTLALIKPDAVAHPLILEAVHQQILSNKFLIVRMRELLWRKEDCQRFYREHEGRFFYQRLVEFMASGPIRAYILAHKDAIQLWRTLMGPTRVFRARHVAPDSIRGSFGLTDTRNTTHGSGARSVPGFDYSRLAKLPSRHPDDQIPRHPDQLLQLSQDRKRDEDYLSYTAPEESLKPGPLSIQKK